MHFQDKMSYLFFFQKQAFKSISVLFYLFICRRHKIFENKYQEPDLEAADLYYHTMSGFLEHLRNLQKIILEELR